MIKDRGVHIGDTQVVNMPYDCKLTLIVLLAIHVTMKAHLWLHFQKSREALRSLILVCIKATGVSIVARFLPLKSLIAVLGDMLTTP